MSYVIDKGVPVPIRGKSKRSELTVTLEKMEVGDSVLVTDQSCNYVDVMALRAGRRLEWKFCTRVVDDGIRVWRVA